MYDSSHELANTPPTDSLFFTLRGAIKYVKEIYASLPEKEKDKQGKFAYLHTLHVVAGLPGDAPYYVILAALLHDVVEDKFTTLQKLEAAGVPPKTLEIVKLLTKEEIADEAPKAEKIRHYANFINTIAESGNFWAIAIKIADMEHNSSPSRVKKLPPEKQNDLAEKYNGNGKLPLLREKFKASTRPPENLQDFWEAPPNERARVALKYLSFWPTLTPSR